MKTQIKNVMFGADPELFLQDKQTGELVSAEGYVKGSKHEPFNFDVTDKDACISLDNVAAEFTIRPARTPEEWEASLLKGINYINSVIPERLCTVAIPAGNFSQQYLQTDNARRFGCESSFNVWLRESNMPPNSSDETLRSTGFHVHTGYSLTKDVNGEEVELTEEEKLLTDEAIVKVMDLFLGLPSIIIEPDNKRRELYGKAGEFRFKPYGVEYRTLSSHFMKDETLRAWVFDNATKAIEYANSVEDLQEVISKEDGELIQSAINNNDKILAKQLCDKYGIPLI